MPGHSFSAENKAAKPLAQGVPSLPLVYAKLGANSFGAQGIHPGTPMVLDPASAGFSFDLGGSDTPKLQLQLAHSLVLETGSHFSSGTAGAEILGLDATLRMPVAKSWNLQGGVDQSVGSTQFHSLGSIQCLNGTLKPDSYTAHGCRFVSESGTQFDRRTLSLGATHESEHTFAAANWFTMQSELGTQGVFKLNQFGPSPLLENRFLSPVSGGSIFPGAASSGYLANEATGIDLNFKVGFATSQEGGIQLGLALTRVLDASYQEMSNIGPNPLDWRLAEAFDSATLGIEWAHGAFSSGIRGYYREPVNFLNRESLDSVSTFDVHFTWRAPWSANLSVGASNVMGAGVNEAGSDGKNADRFESIYGRIPYVRYQQDL